MPATPIPDILRPAQGQRDRLPEKMIAFVGGGNFFERNFGEIGNLHRSGIWDSGIGGIKVYTGRVWPLLTRLQIQAVLVFGILFGGTGCRKPDPPLEPLRDEARWSQPEFAGAGEITLENEILVLGSGKPLTIAAWDPSPEHLAAFSGDFEIRFDACRIEGGDFFASLTFPIRDSHLTLILGGWGGTLVGLSSLDHLDASENETRASIPLENGTWYPVRIRYTDPWIEVRIEDRIVVSENLRGRRLGLKPGDISLSRPFGFASWWSRGSVRNLVVERL